MDMSQLIVFLLSGLALWFLSIKMSIKYENKGYDKKKAWTYPSVIIGAGIGLVISYLVEPTWQEALGLTLFLALFSYVNALIIYAGREKIQAMMDKGKSQNTPREQEDPVK